MNRDIQLHILLSAEERLALERAACEQDRSMVAVVRTALRQHLPHWPQPEAPQKAPRPEEDLRAGIDKFYGQSSFARRV